MKRSILVTGGAGYIGSHTCLQLLQEGGDVTVLDNLSNSSPIALERVEKLTGRKLTFVEGDITCAESLARVFSHGQFDAVVHFAGLKAVGESVAQPLRYYRNNVVGTINLLEAMEAVAVRSLVFSSSATVYGEPEQLPIPESAGRSATSPYGRSKLMVEQLLEDLYRCDNRWRIACLRYFNPVGAHPSGLIGEDPLGLPNNLMPFISQVACGVRENLSVFGADYGTADGTGVRDYIHVMDLAAGHLAALDYLQGKDEGEWLAVNLGTGRGISVLEMIRAFEAASGQHVPYQIVDRRPGDIATCYADATKAKTLLGWQAKLGLREMCADTWRWQSRNPHGFRGCVDAEEVA
jgi:UDP-glucose 4-epimerase